MSELPHVDLVAYLLGGMAEDEQAGVERHLHGCSACTAEIAELRPATRLLERAAPAAHLPAGLERRTLEAVAEAAAAENGRVHEGSSRLSVRTHPLRRRPSASALPGAAPSWRPGLPWRWPRPC